MKILIFKSGAMGDTLMSTPLVRQLRKNFPNAKIDYLIGNTASVALKNNKYLDEIIRFDENIFIKKKIFRWLNLIRNIRKRKYDLIFTLDKHWIFNLTVYLFGIKQRIGFNRLGKEGKFLTKKVYYGPVKHEVYYYLDLLNTIKKADYKDSKIDLFLTKKDKNFAEGFFKRYKLKNKKVIGIAPGGCYNLAVGYDKVRQWPPKNYNTLIKALIKRKYTVILFGGKNDEYIRKFLDIDNKKVIDMMGKSSVAESAALMKKCKAFVCNDSGPMHIASAAGVKVISLFGITHPLRKAPLHNNSKAIWKDEDIYQSDYEVYGTKSKKQFMKRITVKDIINNL